MANVHDLQVPFKFRYCRYRERLQMGMELAGAAFADGVWFTAGVDAAAFREHAADLLAPALVEATLGEAVEAGSPIAFDEFEESYADRPEWLHVAGSLWEKKCADDVLGVAETLHERFGVRTVMTSMEAIPEEYAALPWVEARSEASPAEYRDALSRGDLAVCASEYETMARTPFEQAASGQVLLLRDEPWIYDCVPEDYDLVAHLDDLEALAVRAVERWDEAVAANRRLLDHVREVRSPDACGRRTYRDLRERVAAKVATYDVDRADAPVERALYDLAGTPDAQFALDELVARTAEYTDDGRPVTDRETYSRTDALYALRSLGYEDCGAGDAPEFVRTGRWE
ncbi:hypothetical protein DMJ13_10215 [halophilic archaeon]|nr:hypothetical protein DMJ13_10215 [halophilic archaeon]